VLALQEVWTPRLLRTLRAGLPDHRYAAWQAGRLRQPVGGLVTLSRLPLARVRYVSFRGARPGAGDVFFRTSKAINSRLQGVLIAELAGRAVTVANTHLSANRDGDWSSHNRHHGLQRAQLERLHAALADTAAVTVLAGDLNTPSGGPLYPMVIGNGGWQDPFAATDPATYQPGLLPPGRPPQRIDYLLVRGRAMHEPAVLMDQPVGLPGGRRGYLSDHVALAAVVDTAAGVT
jgi:endonuclease/exonuclease/phosphatase family metal-dependent hydrolase